MLGQLSQMAFSHKMELSLADIDRIIEMAWEDRTSFDAIEIQFGLNEQDVIALMRNQLKKSSWLLWRKRAHQRGTNKHVAKRTEVLTRFKCKLQRSISHNKISKR
jgi:uncharacterized protein (TIGR03643 family)